MNLEFWGACVREGESALQNFKFNCSRAMMPVKDKDAGQGMNMRLGSVSESIFLLYLFVF